jgi:integrase
MARTLKLTKRIIDDLEPAEKDYRVNDSELKGLHIRVTPAGGKVFYLRYRNVQGRERTLKLGSANVLSVPQARDLARAALVDAATGADPAEQKKRNRSHTLESFLRDEYMPWCMANLKTGAKTCNAIKAGFPDLMKKRLHEITAFDVERWRRRHGKDHSAATTNRYQAYLAAALKRAETWGFIEHSPLAGGKVKKAREDNARVRFLDDHELEALMQALDEREERIRQKRDSHNIWLVARGHGLRLNLRECAFADYLKPMVLLSLHTGMRRGEVFNLHWEDIDFQRKIITVHGKGAKSGRTRHIPMNKTVQGTLTGWREMTTDAGRVFRNPKTGRRFDNTYTAWDAVVEASGIENFTWHDMRHHCASMLVQAGVDLYVVKEILGHSSITMTERYAHLAPQQTAAAMATLDRLTPAENVVPFQQAEGKE